MQEPKTKKKGKFSWFSKRVGKSDTANGEEKDSEKNPKPKEGKKFWRKSFWQKKQDGRYYNEERLIESSVGDSFPCSSTEKGRKLAMCISEQDEKKIAKKKLAQSLSIDSAISYGFIS